MNIPPSEALVFEDSIAGIEAARRAGILSFLIKDHLIGLPDHNGKHKLKVDVSLYESNKADYEFYDLHQAKRFLESKGLYSNKEDYFLVLFIYCPARLREQMKKK